MSPLFFFICNHYNLNITMAVYALSRKHYILQPVTIDIYACHSYNPVTRTMEIVLFSQVRYLEAENSRLTREVQTSQETVTREVSNIQQMYDHELSDARKLLDETHREKARLEIDTKRLWDENEELKAVVAKKTKDLVLAENSVRVLETRTNDLTLKYNQAQSDAKKAQTEARDLEKERDKVNLISKTLHLKGKRYDYAAIVTSTMFCVFLLRS